MNVDEENQVNREKRLARIRDQARIFREVFGGWDTPTAHGKVMLDALNTKFSHALPPNVLDNNGRTDEYQTWRRLGHFDVLEFIRTQLEFKETPYVDPSRSSP